VLQRWRAQSSHGRQAQALVLHCAASDAAAAKQTEAGLHIHRLSKVGSEQGRSLAAASSQDLVEAGTTQLAT
jgi:hypothetical protein